MNYVPRLLLLTRPAHETAIYSQKERDGETKMTEQRQRGSETNSITETREHAQRFRR